MSKFWSYFLTGLKSFVGGALTLGLFLLLNKLLLLFQIENGIFGCFAKRMNSMNVMAVNPLWVVVGIFCSLVFLFIDLIAVGFINRFLFKWDRK
jgi:hypothetical protein